jgi:hypothetical protein
MAMESRNGEQPEVLQLFRSHVPNGQKEQPDWDERLGIHPRRWGNLGVVFSLFF